MSYYYAPIYRRETEAQSGAGRGSGVGLGFWGDPGVEKQDLIKLMPEPKATEMSLTF